MAAETWPRSCRLPSLSRSPRGRPARATPGIGPSTAGSKGENATIERIADPCQAATDLAQFIAALQRIDPTGGPPPGAHNSFRGVPLAVRDAHTRAAIASLKACRARWNLTQRPQRGKRRCRPPRGTARSSGSTETCNRGTCWPKQGRLSAVIDFGCLGVGDPACDLIVAWTLFSGKARDMFRAALPVDDATWARGRGWALSFGLIALPYYRSPTPCSPESIDTQSTKFSPITSTPVQMRAPEYRDDDPGPHAALCGGQRVASTRRGRRTRSVICGRRRS